MTLSSTRPLAPTLFACALLGATGLAAERVSDRMVEQIIENIDDGFDRWKDDLEDRNMDEAVLRNAAGTVDVKVFLRDLERDIDTVKDRLDDRYAAGPEVTALLRRASDVERRNQGTGGRPAWQALSTEFGTLASAYGVSWPLEPGENAQRLSDRELADQARTLREAADRLRGPMKDAAGRDVPKETVSAAENDLRELGRAAKVLEEGVKDGRGTEDQAARVLALASKSRSFVSTLGPLNPRGTASLNALTRSSAAIAQAFGQPALMP